jgi:Mg-chelatase subunit ChlD
MLEVQGHNVIVGIDRSGSMNTRDCDSQTRHEFLIEALAAFVQDAATSATGGKIQAVFFNDNQHEEVLISADDVKKYMAQYRPGGGTNTAGAVVDAFKLAQKLTGPSMFFLVTDGEPNDTSAVDAAIVDITKAVKNPEDFRIMILTVGKRDAGLQTWLEHLDNDLAGEGALFDIVGLNNLQEINFREAAAELIASTTTNDEALAGATGGKVTTRID